MKQFILFLLLLISVYGCTTVQSESDEIFEKRNAHFSTIEISYTNGWGERFSFVVDSNKVYFSPQGHLNTYYGILPDSVYQSVYALAAELYADTTIRTIRTNCMDCPVVATQLITSIDTTFIVQDSIHSVFDPVLKSLRTFIKEEKHTVLKSYILLSTREVMLTPPPPAKN